MVSSADDIIFLGTHDDENCLESEGCLEVQATEVWLHQMYEIGGSFHNDIALIK